MTKKINIEVVDDSPFYFGQKIYVVESCGYKTFTTKCPICDDTKKVKIKGIDFDCPHCTSSQYGNRQFGNVLRLTEFGVFEYIVNRVALQGEEVKSKYSHNRKPYVTASWQAFNKGMYVDSVDTISCYEHKVCEEGKEGWSYNPNVASYQNVISINKPIHLTKRSAEQMVREINNKQREMLAEFNEKNGTKYEFPY